MRFCLDFRIVYTRDASKVDFAQLGNLNSIRSHTYYVVEKIED